MKLSQSILTASVLVAAMTGASIANDEKPFTGPYLGIEGGLGHVKQGLEKDGGELSIGGIAGYRHQFDNDFVLGIEGGVNKNFYEPDELGSFFSRDYKLGWSMSGVLGYSFGADKKNLVFIKAGYNRLRFGELPFGVDIPLSDTLAEFVNSLNDSAGSLKLGAGYERKLSNLLSVRLGVDYSKNGQSFEDGREFRTKQLEGKAAFIVNF